MLDLLSFIVVLCVFFTCATTAWAEENYSKLVYPGSDGRLVYVPDEKGNIIPDFSHCGYMGGGVALPDVSVVLTVQPQAEGDDTARLQAAIDDVSARTPDANGFRGALLLQRGKYRIGGTLQIRASGVVLRGEGENGTVLIATGKGQRTLIEFKGQGRRPREIENTRQAIADEYVPVGAKTFAISDASGFAVGDAIIVHRPSTAKWIATIGMDRIEMKHPDVRQWKPGTYDFHFDRTITAINGNQITIDAPMGNAIEREYGGGSIYKYEYPGRIEQVGIENLRGVSEFDNSEVDCVADIAHSDTGPHHRWSVCTLFDNVIVNGNAINVQDRQSSGTGHGWAGAQKVLWNCEAESYILQKPPTSQNYAIGCIGEKRDGWHEREDGYWDSHGQKVHPRSLYLKQLEDRLGMEAVKAIGAQIGEGD